MQQGFHGCGESTLSWLDFLKLAGVFMLPFNCRLGKYTLFYKARRATHSVLKLTINL